jgi:hypothetical protein
MLYKNIKYSQMRLQMGIEGVGLHPVRVNF